LNWKTKYINEIVSDKEEVIRVFKDGLFALVEELNIQGDIEVQECSMPYLKQDITSYIIDKDHVVELDKMIDSSVIHINHLKLLWPGHSVESKHNLCKVFRENGRYYIELDEGDYCLFNRHTVELIYKKIVEEYLFKRKEERPLQVNISVDGIKLGGKAAYPVK
jgi:hypothetical protein